MTDTSPVLRGRGRSLSPTRAAAPTPARRSHLGLRRRAADPSAPAGHDRRRPLPRAWNSIRASSAARRATKSPSAASLSTWAQNSGMWARAVRLRWRHLMRFHNTGPVVLLFTDGTAGLLTGVNTEHKVVFIKDPRASRSRCAGAGRRAAAEPRCGPARRCCCAPAAATPRPTRRSRCAGCSAWCCRRSARCARSASPRSRSAS